MPMEANKSMENAIMVCTKTTVLTERQNETVPRRSSTSWKRFCVTVTAVICPFFAGTGMNTSENRHFCDTDCDAIWH